MQITWLFGNGFDRSFNLKTNYTDFYKYLLENEEALNLGNNRIFSILKEDYATPRIEEWKDYEAKLGSITERFTEEELEVFKNDKLDLDDYLREFLIQTVKNKVTLTKEQIFKIMSESLRDIVNDKKTSEREKVYSILRRHKSEHYVIEAISFNYTNTVSLIWQHTDELQNMKINNYPQQGCLIKIDPPFYLHGTLENFEMIVGVGNKNQISNTSFAESEIIQECLVKNKLLDIAGQQNLQTYKGLISNSQIICLFGLSIGQTDQEYWKIIKERLLHADTLLIIYWYDPNAKEQNITRFNDYVNKVKDIFIKSANATNEERKVIMPKILVEVNHKLFGNIISADKK